MLSDQERNIDTLRFANRTTLRLSETTTAEIGAFVVDRHLKHPIFQWLDYKYVDYGAFGRLTDEREIGGRANRFLVGVNLHNGRNDAKQYKNDRALGGDKGDKTFDARQTSSEPLSLCREHVLRRTDARRRDGAAGAERPPEAGRPLLRRQALNPSDAQDDDSGKKSFTLASPKFGLLWDIDASWQAFANLSKSVETPSYGENSFAAAALAKPQKAWTAEIGTRGRREDFTWDAAAYRARIKDELFCQFNATAVGTCAVVNLDRTMHQGVELGFGVAALKGLLVKGDLKDGGGDKLWLNLAYTFSDFRFDGDRAFGNNKLPGAPRHFVRAEALYKHPAGFFAGPNVEWVPEAYFVDSENTTRTRAYALLGAKIGYDDPAGHFSAYVEGRNLANKKYIASASVTNDARPTAAMPDGPALYEPGTGRAVYAGVKYRW